MKQIFRLFHKIKLPFFVAIAVFIVAKLNGMELIPLIALCAGGSGACACGGSGGCGSSGCGNSAGDPWGSTPFLFTWDGKKFVFENDFLFSKPTSLFQTIEDGKNAYESGQVGGDLYSIKNHFFAKNEKLAFQIKEVEPEESFVEYLSLLHVLYPIEGKLIVDSKYEKFFVFEKRAIEECEGIESQTVVDHNYENITDKIGSARSSLKITQSTSFHKMKTGDTIQINGIVRNGLASQPFLLLGSHYRDWTLGEIFDKQEQGLFKKEIKSVPHSFFSVREFSRGAIKISTMVVLLGFLWFSSAIGGLFRSSSGTQLSKNNDLKKLAETFGAKEVRADVGGGGGGRSLVVEYWDGDTFQEIDVISPRYYQPNVDAVLIPKEAIQDDGAISIRVIATKKHHVTSAVLIAPEEHLDYKVEKLKVSKAFHNREKKDYTDLLNKEGSNQYLHTVPADVIDIEFKTPLLKKDTSIQAEEYLIKAKGFYTFASAETQRRAGNWVERLDSDAREWLKEMYSLKDYDKDNREPVLS